MERQSGGATCKQKKVKGGERFLQQMVEVKYLISGQEKTCVKEMINGCCMIGASTEQDVGSTFVDPDVQESIPGVATWEQLQEGSSATRGPHGLCGAQA